MRNNECCAAAEQQAGGQRPSAVPRDYSLGSSSAPDVITEMCVICLDIERRKARPPFMLGCPLASQADLPRCLHSCLAVNLVKSPSLPSLL